MRFPKFWARGQSGGFSAWRWSDTSVDAARFEAQTVADRLAAQFQADETVGDRYGYANRPLREPVLREFFDSSGTLAHVITRNAYGCHVLNSAVALFVDVDFPDAPPKTGSIFGSLFGKKPPQPDDPAKPALAKAAAWAQAHPGWNWRVYRTKAGLRLLATHALFDSSDSICEKVFEDLGADRLYRRLCQMQNCFRARLTPKPWRCKVSMPPSRWPFPDGSERFFNAWDAKYQIACQAKATCQLLEVGSGFVHPELSEMVTFHDEMTKATIVGLELA